MLLEMGALEREAQATEHALAVERKAVHELRATMAAESGTSKEAFAALKLAVGGAHKLSQGVTVELEEAVRFGTCRGHRARR